MSHPTTPPRDTAAPPETMRSPGSRKEDWIASQLRRVYDDALQDSIPQPMLDLLRALDDDGDDGARK